MIEQRIKLELGEI